MSEPRETQDRKTESSEPNLKVETATESRATIIEQAGADDRLRDSLIAATVLIVPFSGHGGYVAPVFPQGTMEVLQAFRDGLPAGVNADIGVSDEQYEELTLHAAAIILPTLLVPAWATTIVLGLVTNYLYDRLKDLKARRETRVRARMLVETPTRTVSIEYDGPALQFSELTTAAFEHEVPPAERERGLANGGALAQITDGGRKALEMPAGAELPPTGIESASGSNAAAQAPGPVLSADQRPPQKCA